MKFNEIKSHISKLLTDHLSEEGKELESLLDEVRRKVTKKEQRSVVQKGENR